MRLVAGEVLVVVSRCRGGFFCGAGALCTCYRNAVPPPVRDKHPLSRQLFNDAIKLAVGYKQNSGDFMDEVMRELEVSRVLLAALVTPWGLCRGWKGRGGALWRAHTALGMTGESHSCCSHASQQFLVLLCRASICSRRVGLCRRMKRAALKRSPHLSKAWTWAHFCPRSRFLGLVRAGLRREG